MVRTLALIGALLFVHGVMAATITFDFNKGFSQKLADQQLTVQSGDEIVFTWTGTHNVYKMKDKAAYDACSFDGSTLLGEQSGTKTTISGGTKHYFSCSVGTHCKSGQKLEVTVGITASSSTAAMVGTLCYLKASVRVVCSVAMDTSDVSAVRFAPKLQSTASWIAALAMAVLAVLVM